MNGRIELFIFKLPDAFDIHSRPLYRQISLLIPQSIVCQGIHVLALFPCAVKLDTRDIRRMDASALTGTGGYASVEKRSGYNGKSPSATVRVTLRFTVC